MIGSDNMCGRLARNVIILAKDASAEECHSESAVWMDGKVRQMNKVFIQSSNRGLKSKETNIGFLSFHESVWENIWFTKLVRFSPMICISDLLKGIF